MKPIVSAITAGTSALLIEIMAVLYHASDIGNLLYGFSRTLVLAIIFIASFPISAILAACEYSGILHYYNMTSFGAIVAGLIGPIFWGSMAYLIHRHLRRCSAKGKKAAAIISVGFLAIMAGALFLLYQSLNVPELSKRPPILFPPQDRWPPDVKAAFTHFKALKGKWRGDQEQSIVQFSMLCEYKQNPDYGEYKSAPLTRKDILTLLGPPEHESKYCYSYKTERRGCSVSYLTIFFNRGKACLIGSGSGLTSNATEEELIIPPDENETEQAGPGYPPQGVGSPDP